MQQPAVQDPFDGVVPVGLVEAQWLQRQHPQQVRRNAVEVVDDDEERAQQRSKYHVNLAAVHRAVWPSAVQGDRS